MFSVIYHNFSQMVATPSGYYYFGGYDMNAKEITVLMVEPGQHPKVTKIKDDFCNTCNGGFGVSGRRVVGENQSKTCSC